MAGLSDMVNATLLKRSLLLMAWTQNVALTKSPTCAFVADPVDQTSVRPKPYLNNGSAARALSAPRAQRALRALRALRAPRALRALEP